MRAQDVKLVAVLDIVISLYVCAQLHSRQQALFKHKRQAQICRSSVVIIIIIIIINGSFIRMMILSAVR